MSKKKNKTVKAEESKKPVTEQSAPEEQASAPIFAPENLDPVMTIDDAAMRYIDKYHTRWLSALQSYASTMGIDPKSVQSASLWKDVFKKWGAIIK